MINVEDALKLSTSVKVSTLTALFYKLEMMNDFDLDSFFHLLCNYWAGND